MATEHAHAWTAEAGLLLPADGLRLLGQHDGHGGRRFLVGRSDGQVVQLARKGHLRHGQGEALGLFDRRLRRVDGRRRAAAWPGGLPRPLDVRSTGSQP